MRSINKWWEIMDKAELHETIQNIFDREYINRKRAYSYKKTLYDYAKLTILNDQMNNNYIREPVMLIEAEPDEIKLDYETLDVMLMLYDNIRLNEENQELFIEKISSYIGKGEMGTSLSIEILIKIGKIDNVITLLLNATNKKVLMQFYECVSIIDKLLYFEYYLFSVDDLKNLKVIFKKYYNVIVHEAYSAVPPIQKVIDRITLLLYEHTKKVLGLKTNFEINYDREKVKEKINEFNFDPNLAIALDEIDEYYHRKALNEFEYSMAIAPLREFFNTLIENICKKIYEKTKEKYPTSENTKIANLRVYMKTHLELQKEHQLINKLIDMINYTGSHSLISEREYFRLTKNVSIEMALLLLTKLNRFLLEE